MPRVVSDHFDGKRFFNPGGRQVRGFADFLRWKLTSRPAASPEFIRDNAQPDRDLAAPLNITLINHATVLIELNGRNILTDPIWSDRASPVSFAGPKRRRAPGMRLEDLPPIHDVLLTHNHYDHLDLPTLRKLLERDVPAFTVPLGLSPLLRGIGAANISELDWWESNAGIQAVPAYHFSARSALDRNRTLWCGYRIGSVYFAGDTAAGPHFAEIRERSGRPEVALLPVGAYQPRWFMSPVHLSPEDALRVHRTLDPKLSIGIHQGTFQLADEALDAPRTAVEWPRNFLLPRNGETIRPA